MWSVSGLQRMLRSELERTHQNVYVGGEISSLQVHGQSGHAYFLLKDPQAQLYCVMFRSDLTRLRFRLQEGQEVILRGRLTVFEKSGRLQLTVQTVEPQGRGAQEEAFRQLAEKLRQEGLTAPERKRRLPFFPRTVGIVTSSSGAALRDVVRTALRRDPGVELIISATAVQGDGAASEIARAIERLDRLAEVEVIILARGGGSREDLWAFNEEPVARAIVRTRAPVVTGIGHETDTAIADLVADHRASTPTAATELVIPVRREIEARFGALWRRLTRAVQAVEQRKGRALGVLEGRLAGQAPLAQLRRRAQELDELTNRGERSLRIAVARSIQRLRALERRLDRTAPAPRFAALTARLARIEGRSAAAIERTRSEARRRLTLLAARLEALSPIAVLGRGYALVLSADGGVVQRASQVEAGDRLLIRLAQGEITARVESTRAPEEEKK